MAVFSATADYGQKGTDEGHLDDTAADATLTARHRSAGRHDRYRRRSGSRPVAAGSGERNSGHIPSLGHHDLFGDGAAHAAYAPRARCGVGDHRSHIAASQPAAKPGRGRRRGSGEQHLHDRRSHCSDRRQRDPSRHDALGCTRHLHVLLRAVHGIESVAKCCNATMGGFTGGS